MRKALVVGINDYPNQPLTGCINDANAIANTLTSNGDGSPNFDVVLNTQINNKAELMGLIKTLFNSGDVETSLLYFSGHGIINNLGGFIVTPDYKEDDEGISMSQILALANSSRAKNKVIILDCCNSGALGLSVTSSAVCNLAEGVTILTASKENESSVEMDGHGIFTNLLLGALSGGAADLTGYISPGSIYSYIDKALGPWDQRPVFQTYVTEFTSIRNVQPPISLDILRKLTTYFNTAQEEFKLGPEFEFTYEKSDPIKVLIMKDLQMFERNGLVVPVGESFMYFAAMNSKSCKLTALGWRYWDLVKKNRI